MRANRSACASVSPKARRSCFSSSRWNASSSGKSSFINLHWPHHACDGLHQRAPAGMLEHGLLFAGACQGVIPRATPGSGNTPLLFHETFRLEAPESGIERSMLHLQQVLRSLSDGLGNLVTIGLALLEDAQDHHIQRSLQNVDLSGIAHKVM